MGTWGTGLYSSDIALDVRGTYRDCSKLGFASEELADLVMDLVGAGPDSDAEDTAVASLALADQLWKDGTLSGARLEEALRLTGAPLLIARWEDTASQRKQAEALSALAAKLSSAQRAPKKPKSRYTERCEFAVGEVLALPVRDGEWTLLRVVAHFTRFRGLSPIVEALDWTGVAIPERAEVERLSFRKQANVPETPPIPEQSVAALIDAGRLPPGSSWRDFDEQMAAPYIPVIRIAERDPHFGQVVRLGYTVPATRPFLSHWYVATNGWTTWKDLPSRLVGYFEPWPEDTEPWPDE